MKDIKVNPAKISELRKDNRSLVGLFYAKSDQIVHVPMKTNIHICVVYFSV